MRTRFAWALAQAVLVVILTPVAAIPLEPPPLFNPAARLDHSRVHDAGDPR